MSEDVSDYSSHDWRKFTDDALSQMIKQKFESK